MSAGSVCGRSTPRFGLVGTAVLGLLVLSCNGEEPAAPLVEQTRQALTAVEIDRVLGFESPVADWHVIWGGVGTISASTTASQGTRSLSLNGKGYVPLESVALSSLGSRVGSVIRYDIRLPSTMPDPYWYGDTHLHVEIPSLGVNNSYLGQIPLTGRPRNQWFTVSYTIPADLKAKLLGTYNDLRLRVVMNVSPLATATYLVDNLRFSDGTLGVCQNADGTYKGSTVVCRVAAGSCDVEEKCTGTGPDCPADGFVPASANVVCRAAASACDVAEKCTGTGPGCPADGFVPASANVVCRAVAGPCDVPETCPGDSPACPPDGFLQISVPPCRPAVDICDAPESCTGSGPACPEDGLQPSVFVCRGSAGACDPEETCTGFDRFCPPDETTSGPAVPAGLAAAPGDRRVTLTWNAVPAAIGYNVKRSASSGGPFSLVGTPAGPLHVDSGLSNGTTYHYAVSAVSDCGESADSAPVPATPAAPPPGFCSTQIGALLCDDFEDGDATNPPWVPAQDGANGAFSVVTDGTYVYRQQTAGTGDARFVSVAGGGQWTDVTVEAKVKVLQFGPEIDDFVGLFVRYNPATNIGGYYLGLKRDNQFKLRKKDNEGNGHCVNATWPNTACQHDHTITPGVWYTLKLQVQGNKLTASIDNVKVAEGTDTQYPGPGAIAVGSFGGSTFEVDDIVVNRGCYADADCDDANACTRESCQAGACLMSFEPLGTACCQDTLCDAQGHCTLAPCDTDADCDDANACTLEICQSGACVVSTEPPGASCGHNVVCGADGSCNPATCDAAADCPDDDNTCTVATCANSVCGTSFQPQGTSCGPDAVCDAGGSCTLATDFTYDALARLVAVAQNGTTREGYGYDHAGNRCVVSDGTYEPVVGPNGYCLGGEANEHYYSNKWSAPAEAENNVTSKSDSDGTFTLTWPLLDYTKTLSLWHAKPDGTGEYVFQHMNGPFRTEQGFSLNGELAGTHGLSGLSGTHSFRLRAEVIQHDDSTQTDTSTATYTDTLVSKNIRFDITVN